MQTTGTTSDESRLNCCPLWISICLDGEPRVACISIFAVCTTYRGSVRTRCRGRIGSFLTCWGDLIHVMPILPIYVHFEEKAPNFARLSNFLLPRLRQAFQRTFRYAVQWSPVSDRYCLDRGTLAIEVQAQFSRCRRASFAAGFWSQLWNCPSLGVSIYTAGQRESSD